MKIFNEPKKLQKWCTERRLEGRRIALIPTMGYLHEGHLSLIERAKAHGADEIVVSVFVNPVQFGPNEDFEKYPRDEKADLRKCTEAGATAMFFPTPANMYLPNYSVFVNEEELSLGLCGARRPGHFRGVCTVVAKLFNLTHPNFAVFGQKDYQQVQVIKRMTRDLNFDIEILMAPIVRDEYGLARSSRNVYLNEKDRNKALAISQGLRTLRPGAKLSQLKAQLVKAGLTVDYVECVDPSTLKPHRQITRGSCVMVAAYAGRTRLIDNRII